jgi:hypothetical protein
MKVLGDIIASVQSKKKKLKNLPGSLSSLPGSTPKSMSAASLSSPSLPNAHCSQPLNFANANYILNLRPENAKKESMYLLHLVHHQEYVGG